jgi:undecaprenyl-diphosphatase
MTFIQAILLGLLQGLTEFLPVSSTAHMAIVPQLFGMDDPGAAFSAIVQLGPIVAIIAYFRGEISRYWKGIVRTKSPKNIPVSDIDARLGWYTLIGTIPMVVFGVLLEKKVDTQFRQMYVIAFSLIALALVLVYAEAVGKKSRSLKTVTLQDSLFIGFAQVLALVPGASRSGVTITAGLFKGLDRESAAKFSFLLSIPAITGAGLFKIFRVVTHDHSLGGHLVPYLLSAVVAGFVAYAVVNWFLGFMKEHSTRGFIIYRIVLGIAVIVLVQMHYIKPNRPVTLDAPASAPAAQTP